MSDTEAFIGRICTGLDRPSRSGPITVPPPSCLSSCELMLALCSAGMISTLAGADRRQNG